MYYTTLGVARSATPEEISKAYRRLAMKHHPDRNPGDASAVEKFKEVVAAYEVLSDPDKKAEFDLRGHVGRRAQHPHNNPPPRPKKPEPKKKPEPPKSHPHNSQDIQCSYFGGTMTGKNILTNLYLSKEEMESGGKFEVWVRKRDTCGGCMGDGNRSKLCQICRGSGKMLSLVHGRQFADMAPDCHHCKGNGIIYIPCQKCKGEGVWGMNTRSVHVTIPPKCQQGQQVTVVGEGELAPLKMPGYLRVVVLERV